MTLLVKMVAHYAAKQSVVMAASDTPAQMDCLTTALTVELRRTALSRPQG